MTRGRVAIRADAGPLIGLGHVSRCRVLAAALQHEGFDVRLIVAEPRDHAIEQRISPIPVSWIPVPSHGQPPVDFPAHELADALETLALIGSGLRDTSWVVVDHYRLGESWEHAIRAQGHRVLAIDDFRHRGHCAHVLVSDVAVPFDPLLNRCGSSPTELTGPSYALVDPAFARETGPGTRDSGPEPRILVSYGGSDPTGETEKALEALLLAYPPHAGGPPPPGIDVVIGPTNARADAIVARVDEIARGASSPPDIVVHRAVPSLAPLLRATGLVLTAGGQSMVEALAMGRHCVVTETAPNQSLAISHLAAANAIVRVGAAASVTAAHIARAIGEASARAIRSSDDARPASGFDTLGASRIAAVLRAAEDNPDMIVRP